LIHSPEGIDFALFFVFDSAFEDVIAWNVSVRLNPAHGIAVLQAGDGGRNAL
jgi:hypothetical protein